MNATRSRLAAALAGAVAVGLTASSAAAAGAQATLPLTVVSADASAAPDVRLVVAAPPALAGRDLDASAFTVREGGATPALTVEALPADQIDVALVIDTSGSMAGAPIASAKSAARSLLAQLPPAVPVAVVGFGAAPVVATPRTTDRDAVLAAVDALEARGETALYDALHAALGQLPAGGAARRFVVLLSDGGDTTSRATLDATGRALAAARVPVFAVELKTAESNTAALVRLASATGGQAVAASDPTALAGVFDGIAKQLVRQYALSWRAVSGGPVVAEVVLEAGGVRAEARAFLELPAAPPVAGSSGATDGGGGASGTWHLAGGAALVGLALLFVLVQLLAFRTPRSRALGGGRLSDAGRGIATLGDQARSAADRILHWAHRGPALNALLERAGLDLRPAELVVVVACGSFALALTAGALVHPLAGLVAAAAAVVAARAVLEVLAARRRALFADQLPDTLGMLAGALRAGYALSQAVDVVAREAEAPTSDEFRRVTMENRLGREFGEAMEALAERVRSKDFDWVVQAFRIHREVGGDLAEVLENVTRTIRDRNRVRRQVRAVSAEGRMSAAVLFVLPFAMAVIMSLFNGEYLKELFESTEGRAMVGAAAVLMAAGAAWLNRIVKPKF